MKEVRIDLSKAVCQDPIEKIKSVLAQIKEQNLSISRLEILGDQALEGIENFLINHRYIIETSGSEECFRILIKGKEEEAPNFLEEKSVVLEGKLLFLKDDKLGEGELGKRLLDRVLNALSKGSVFPKEIVLLNRAVLLCAENKREALQDLLYLERKGVRILACKTCLEYFGILEKMCVGEVSSASIIAEKLIIAQNVISL